MNINLSSLIVLTVVGESVWETCKMIWQNGKFSVDRVGAIAVGLLLSIGTGTDILAMAGISHKIPLVGMILTGLLISRGSNFIHDFVQGISSISKTAKQSSIQNNVKNQR